MPRYFFHLYNDEVTQDEEGSELPDAHAAFEWARRQVRFEAGQSVKERAHLVLNHRVVVVDEAGREVGIVTFGDVVRVVA